MKTSLICLCTLLFFYLDFTFAQQDIKLPDLGFKEAHRLCLGGGAKCLAYIASAGVFSRTETLHGQNVSQMEISKEVFLEKKKIFEKLMERQKFETQKPNRLPSNHLETNQVKTCSETYSLVSQNDSMKQKKFDGCTNWLTKELREQLDSL